MSTVKIVHTLCRILGSLAFLRAFRSSFANPHGGVVDYLDLHVFTKLMARDKC